MNSHVKMEYDHWIVSMATSWCSDYGHYSKLMERLHATPFYATVRLDENRAADGKAVRLRFVEEHEIYTYQTSYLYLEHYDVSMLEVMVGLALRCEENIMRDNDLGDRSNEWFYGMLVSSGLDLCLDEYFDPDMVDRIVTRILERKYDRNGKGGLFTLINPPKDLRKVEIWYQLLWYLDEVIFS